MQTSAQDSSVSDRIVKFEACDHIAAQKLWERDFCRLVGLARAKLWSLARQAVDELDVAVVAWAGVRPPRGPLRLMAFPAPRTVWNNAGVNPSES
jgi:hypothetical protein